MKETITTSKAPRPISPISQATAAAGWIYTCGLLGRTPDGELLEGMEAQARQIMENLKAILEAASGILSDVLRCEVHVVDLAEMPLFNKVWREYFPENPPARVGTQTAALGAGARVEMTAVAYTGNQRG